MTKDKTRATSNTASYGPAKANKKNTKKPTRLSISGKSKERPGGEIGSSGRIKRADGKIKRTDHL